MMYTMKAISGLGFGGPITGSPSGTIYTPSGTGVITGVQLQDVATLQSLGYYVTPSSGASSTTGAGSAGSAAVIASGAGGSSTVGNGADAGDISVLPGAGGVSTGGNGNGGRGGDIILTPGALGAKNGSGTAGRKGQILVTGIPVADPHVVGALWANSAIVTVSAG